jgi:hypothetical protein
VVVQSVLGPSVGGSYVQYFVYCKRLVRCLLVRRPTRRGGGEGQRLLNNIFLSRLGAQRPSGNRCASGCWRRCARLEAGGWRLDVGGWTLEVGGGWPSSAVVGDILSTCLIPRPSVPTTGAWSCRRKSPYSHSLSLSLSLSHSHLVPSLTHPIIDSVQLLYSYCTVAVE